MGQTLRVKMLMQKQVVSSPVLTGYICIAHLNVSKWEFMKLGTLLAALFIALGDFISALAKMALSQASAAVCDNFTISATPPLHGE